ncbi:unnamed protein product [Cladocopium goreaui]|uniref:Tyr recombinase domain-containing protein n=1 Tax=Cladocopium goreaui TaxID=2562237 RepID=A0A9P1BMB2_9DINO|nr:unnamed protein product [Cladocopium goreaui]
MQAMGAQLAGPSDPLADVAGLSRTDRDRMHNAISDAQLSCSVVPDIVMPWNLPGLSMVLGDESETIVPSVPTVPGYVEPALDHLTQDRPSLPVRTKATAFEHAIAFDSRRVVHLDDDEQFRLLVQKWEAMLSINYHAFDLGVEISGLSQEERLRAVSEVLGGKAVATVRQRLAQLGKYVKWATSDAKLAGQNRPMRKQSSVLTVSALQFLEAELDNENLALVDRYAIGVVLFATYSRARFGDLRKISSVILDEANSTSTGCLGYIEMNSASHKMRAFGNRLGAHVPLVAPIKGLGKTAWGKTFISLATKVGLNLTAWCPLCPLLPAPNLMGDWTGRATTSGEINKWIVQLLVRSGFDTSGFSPHGCKATTLTMLAKYGADLETRLILGHHQTKQGTSEVYARDVQSAPLRVLETMFRDIRLGHFCPDETRSGMIQKCDGTVSLQPTLLPLPAVGEDVPEEPSMMPVVTNEVIFGDVDSEGTSMGPPTESLNEDAGNGAPEEDDDSSSSSSTSSSEDSLDEMVEELAQQPRDDTIHEAASSDRRQPSFFQHRSSKVVHMLSQGFGKSFLCGRQLSKEYRACSLLLVVGTMKCQQCVKRHKGRSRDIDDAQLDSAVKRARVE